MPDPDEGQQPPEQPQPGPPPEFEPDESLIEKSKRAQDPTEVEHR